MSEIAAFVHHISFAVRDLERACEFYEGLLGLERIPRPDFGVPGAWYRSGETQIHLIAVPEEMDVGTRPEGISPLGNHSAFAVEDYGKTLDHFKSRGIEVLETRPEQGQMWIRDPDGNVLEFISTRP